MSERFVRVGPLTEATSYPDWTQRLLADCDAGRRRVVEHEFFRRLRDAELGAAAMRRFLVGVWPVIEQFPQYMALNLLKVRAGRHPAEDMARHFLIRNIRVEQNHADYWMDWAEACGITRAELLAQQAPSAMQKLAHWCWHTCSSDPLLQAMAATHYAVEGATGEWAALVCSRDTYAASFEPGVRRRAMKWLRVHAHYDDTHPWEALEIVCTLIGTRADAATVAALETAILTSYDAMRQMLDLCLAANRVAPPVVVPRAFVKLD